MFLKRGISRQKTTIWLANGCTLSFVWLRELEWGGVPLAENWDDCVWGNIHDFLLCRRKGVTSYFPICGRLCLGIGNYLNLIVFTAKCGNIHGSLSTSLFMRTTKGVAWYFLFSCRLCRRDSMKVLFNPESTGDFIVSKPKSRGCLFVCLPDKALSDNLVITIIGTVQQQLVCSSPVLAALPTPSSPSGGESRCLHHQFILILTTSGILIFILTTPVSFILILPTPVSFILILTRPWNSHMADTAMLFFSSRASFRVTHAKDLIQKLHKSKLVANKQLL